MNFLDMRTVIFTMLVTNSLCMLLLIFLWRQNRSRFEGIHCWVADFALQTAALLLIVSRGGISDWMSIVLSNLSDGRIFEINDGFERMTGYASAEIVGKTSLEITGYTGRETGLTWWMNCRGPDRCGEKRCNSERSPVISPSASARQR